MKKKICFLMIFVLLMSLLPAFGLANPVKPEDSKQKQQTENKQEKIIVKEQLLDEKGQIIEDEVSILAPPKKVVVLGCYGAEMLKAIGVENTVIAVDDYTKEKNGWPDFVKNIPSVGASNTPSIEKIIELKPDLVIEGFLDPKLKTQLLNCGIPVLKIYGYRTELITSEIETLGKVFKCQTRAHEYANYIEKQWQAIRDRTKGLTEKDKPKVYWESGLGDWKTQSYGSGAHSLIEWAGGINIAADQKLSYPTVTPEWVASKNPDVIIKYVDAPITGWNGDIKKLEEIRQQILNRPALKNTNAVKNGRVYLVSSKITCAPQGAAGEWYIAKWLHPELFKDVNPQSIHKEMLKKFYGQEYKGVWVYPVQ
ncbi:ABC-type Fe3+-hydroxamate transport system, periplasmic component [Thermoanaerobacter kivui]|uniref:ABC-type Fe3+-hydroxamate transport system, periplasmic component n=1 Tax=Thermoanaerobacter kivui TaxID=2325 RepID=A0A097APH7_THEKI|nr:ABC transporter substrate-binding protein [Thermoanaerobacter kivui]AIS51723.1 ABC-type Fe3+-hydroxamate transport system, periplasmic component [Thermoanaerobacter kivui]